MCPKHDLEVSSKLRLGDPASPFFCFSILLILSKVKLWLEKSVTWSFREGNEDLKDCYLQHVDVSVRLRISEKYILDYFVGLVTIFIISLYTMIYQ